ncbi:hypothetical protein JG687_00005772 [Phytophthora cactorum]|uniref:Uncharacterized protein n=1 Tax=Phytophthora cactorum TaxID=29920 RepID=A0A8T1UJZ2_9STRA|nr:hypothetical protein JG687_00005772 [Phytophthora cactorum]
MDRCLTRSTTTYRLRAIPPSSLPYRPATLMCSWDSVASLQATTVPYTAGRRLSWKCL